MEDFVSKCWYRANIKHYRRDNGKDFISSTVFGVWYWYFNQLYFIEKPIIENEDDDDLLNFNIEAEVSQFMEVNSLLSYLKKNQIDFYEHWPGNLLLIDLNFTLERSETVSKTNFVMFLNKIEYDFTIKQLNLLLSAFKTDKGDNKFWVADMIKKFSSMDSKYIK